MRHRTAKYSSIAHRSELNVARIHRFAGYLFDTIDAVRVFAGHLKGFDVVHVRNKERLRYFLVPWPHVTCEFSGYLFRGSRDHNTDSENSYPIRACAD